jgi:hypothetical protein
MKKHQILCFLLVLAAITWMAWVPFPNQKTFTVRNRLNIDRKGETISLPVSQLSSLVRNVGVENLLIKDAQTGKVLLSQPLDTDGDGEVDELLFQTDIAANGTKKYIVEGVKNGASQPPSSQLTTYSRFVPERIDDYAWENDRVAFRTYGPVAQQYTEAGRTDGTLTSGIDCWLKRVNYPIIDKWYQKNTEEPGAYHKDSGEGYDPYHVGDSRGCGGIGIWDKDHLYVSKNFTGYRILAKGPIRTVFELTYAPWDANGMTVREKKRISLDLGSNLSRYEVELKSNQPLPNCTIGITLHDKKGEVKANHSAGWFRYWEPINDSQLGTGLVIDPRKVPITSYKDHRVDQKDQSHLYVITKPVNGQLVYYAGFGWARSGQFDSPEAWDAYLADFAERLSSPLEISWGNK